MRKHRWLIVLVLVFALALPVAANQVIKIYVNDQEVKTDVAPQVINGRTMVPIRAIAEYLGSEVKWDPQSNTVNITGKNNLAVTTAISAEWATAGHANLGYPLTYAGIRESCQPCHSGNSLQLALTDSPYSPEFQATPDKTYVYDTRGTEMPSPIDCATCHSGIGAEMIETGIMPGEFNVYDLGTDWDVGNGNALCYTCHNGRRDANKIYESWATPGATKQRSYPHHAVGALVTGKGGMEYPDATYAHTKAHENMGCIGCHMTETEEGYISHKFSGVDIKSCQTCHPGATEFTLGGKLQKELEGKLGELEKMLMAQVPDAVRIGTGNSDFPFVDQEGKLVDINNLSTEVLVGAYNFVTVKQEIDNFGQGVHNPKYAKSLLDESIKRLQ